MVEVGAVEALQRNLLRFGDRDLAVLVQVFGGKQALAELGHAGIFHPRLHLARGGVELGPRDRAVLVDVAAREQSRKSVRLRVRRLAALGRKSRVSSVRFGLRDLTVLVGVEPGEDLAGIEAPGSLGGLRFDLPGHGVGFGPGHGAILVGVEAGEHALDLPRHIGAKLGLVHRGGAGTLRRGLWQTPCTCSQDRASRSGAEKEDLFIQYSPREFRGALSETYLSAS